MKTVDYFGVKIQVPDNTKVIAMDGKRSGNRVTAFNTAIRWVKGGCLWVPKQYFILTECNTIVLSKSQIKVIRSQTKPKHSLVVL